MNGHSSAYLKEFLASDPGCQMHALANGEAAKHIRNILDDNERANGAAPSPVDEMYKPFDPVAAAPTIAAGNSNPHANRYHYALGQLDKAREYLLQGRAAAAMDAIHRATEGIIEE